MEVLVETASRVWDAHKKTVTLGAYFLFDGCAARPQGSGGTPDQAYRSEASCTVMSILSDCCSLWVNSMTSSGSNG